MALPETHIVAAFISCPRVNSMAFSSARWAERVVMVASGAALLRRIVNCSTLLPFPKRRITDTFCYCMWTTSKRGAHAEDLMDTHPVCTRSQEGRR